MSGNLFLQFQRLIPAAPLLVCAVISTSAEGSIVSLPGGALIRVRGTAAVGSRVFVRAGVIENAAPDFTPQTIEI